jgi:hypothetical protein
MVGSVAEFCGKIGLRSTAMATLSFKGKPFIQNYRLAAKYHELIPVKKKRG